MGISVEGPRVPPDGPSGRDAHERGVLLGGLTAVVLNWDRPKLTAQCVESLVSVGVPAGRIVVVDNGSSPDNYGQLQQTLGDCILVRLSQNVGIARAFNIGAAHLPGDTYLLLNNDAFVHGPSSVVRLAQALTRDGIGIAAPRLLNEDLTLQPSVVALLTPRTALVGALGLSRLIPNRWQPRWGTHWDHAASCTVEAANGAVFAVRGETWQRLGGMTELRWMYGEDLDLCRRARALGWGVWYEHEATFIHLGSSTVRDHWSDVTRAGMISASEVATLRAQLTPLQAAVTISLLVLGTAARLLVFAALRNQRAAVYRSVLRGYAAAIWSREPQSGGAA